MYANRATRPATEWFAVALVFLLIVSTLVVRFDLVVARSATSFFSAESIGSVTTPLELAGVSGPSTPSLVGIDVATIHAAAVGNRNEPGFFRDY